MRGTFAHGPLSSASLAGLATNLKDGALWGLLPILLAGRGLSLAAVGMVVALYPMVWAGSQLFFGPLSDRVGQRGLIATGLLVQAAGVAGFVASSSFGAALVAALTVGLGTGMVYPTLLAFVSHQAGPTWRATALGVYRFWRDLGYAAGALLSGLLADVGGIGPSFLGVAILLVLGATVFWIVSGPRERQARSGRP